MSWYRVRLPAGQAGSTYYAAVRYLFEQLFCSASAQSELAMFSVPPVGTTFQDLYFSIPKDHYAEVFVRVAAAKPCERPPLDATLEIGHTDARALLREDGL
jgi:hypothetical protein